MPEAARVTATNADAKVEKAPSKERTPEACPQAGNVHAQLLFQQKTIGNQAVQKLIRSGSLPAPRRTNPPARRPARKQDEDITLQPLYRQTVREETPNPPLHADSPASWSPRLTRLGPEITSNSPRLSSPPKHKLGTLGLHRAWYNFDIPFTDYQFDPSIEGVKTAANVVKDTAVAGFDWIVDEIKSLVSSGIDWLSEKWNAIQDFASSALDAATNSFNKIIDFVKSPLNLIADAITSLDAQSVSKAWATFSGIVSTVSNGFKTMTDGLLQQVNNLWGGISGFATSLLDRISSLTQNFIFKKLPDAIQRVAFAVIDKLKSLWSSINDGWNKLFNKVKSWIDSAIDKVFSFVRRVLSFGINVVINGIVQFGQLVIFLKDLFSNPQKYIDILAEKSVQALDSVESKFAGVVGKYFGSATKADPSKTSTTIHRQAAAGTATEAKSSASWSDIGNGVLEMMTKKWKEFKANPLSVLKTLVRDMFVPIIGNVQDVIQLFQDIKKIVTGPLSSGSLEELWTSFLQILDIPILIYNAIVGILGRTLFLPLIVASFVRHPLVTAIASAVGWGLLGAFIQGEVANIEHKLLLLRTGATTKDQKDAAFNRVADSLIGMAMAAIAIVIMIILHFIGNMIRGVYNFVKTRIFPVERVVPEVKPEVKPDDVKPDTKPTTGVCFVSGTPVQTPEGAVPIETLVAGRRVTAKADGCLPDAYLVLDTHRGSTSTLFHIQVAGSSTITSTRNHPFYAIGRGWINAGQLAVGDHLVSVAGLAVPVTSVRRERLAKPATTFNLRVDKVSTYFVGSDIAVWVHNADPKDPVFNGRLFWGLGATGPRQRGVDPPDPALDKDGASAFESRSPEQVGRIMEARVTQNKSNATSNMGALSEEQLAAQGLVAVKTEGEGPLAKVSDHYSIRPADSPDPNVPLTAEQKALVKQKLDTLAKEGVAAKAKPRDFGCG